MRIQISSSSSLTTMVLMYSGRHVAETEVVAAQCQKVSVETLLVPSHHVFTRGMHRGSLGTQTLISVRL